MLDNFPTIKLEIVNGCPLLVSLKVVSYVPCEVFAYRCRELSSFNPHTSLRKFEEFSLEFNDGSIQYFMHKFPNPKELTLSPMEERIQELDNVEDVHCSSKLAK